MAGGQVGSLAESLSASSPCPTDVSAQLTRSASAGPSQLPIVALLLALNAYSSRSAHPPRSELSRTCIQQCPSEERAEIKQAFGIHGDEFAVQDSGPRFQPDEPGGDGGKPGGQIVTKAAQEAHLCAGLVELQAPAVELDLMRPSRTARQGGPERRLAWRDEVGEVGHGSAMCGDGRTGEQRARGQ
jgi:hypothetical protein